MRENHEARCIASALWAAYGDALGFPTELASPGMVRERTGSSRISTTVAWKRLVGGRFGAMASLPAGAYSDDTQLRLATARSIAADGVFDVEAFAKIELPVWLAYALGAGRGSKAAASSLSSPSTNWFSNFYKSKNGTYSNGGGNGAAMRIQPHIWAAHDLARASYLSAVLRNSVCTHGNLRGIGGALIHAVSLGSVFLNQSLPAPDDWMDFAQVIDRIPTLVNEDSDLATFWLPAWERENNTSLSFAASEAADEWAEISGQAVKLLQTDPFESYLSIVETLGGLSAAERGSGTKTALFALVAAWLFRKMPIDEGLSVIANVLQSDTDSIATMAGALLGALDGDILPDAPLQDREYIVQSAKRLASISLGKTVENFCYPDILYWQPPRNAVDGVGLVDGELVLSGLGGLKPLSETFSSRQKDGIWQWFELPFGQSVLCKRRENLGNLKQRVLEENLLKLNSMSQGLQDFGGGEGAKEHQFSLSSVESRPDEISAAKKIVTQAELGYFSKKAETRHIDELTDIAIQSGFSATTIGEHILLLSDGDDSIEKSIAYVAIISKAWRARKKKQRR